MICLATQAYVKNALLYILSLSPVHVEQLQLNLLLFVERSRQNVEMYATKKWIVVIIVASYATMASADAMNRFKFNADAEEKKLKQLVGAKHSVWINAKESYHVDINVWFSAIQATAQDGIKVHLVQKNVTESDKIVGTDAKWFVIQTKDVTNSLVKPKFW